MSEPLRCELVHLLEEASKDFAIGGATIADHVVEAIGQCAPEQTLHTVILWRDSRRYDTEPRSAPTPGCVGGPAVGLCNAILLAASAELWHAENRARELRSCGHEKEATQAERRLPGLRRLLGDLEALRARTRNPSSLETTDP